MEYDTIDGDKILDIGGNFTIDLGRDEHDGNFNGYFLLNSYIGCLTLIKKKLPKNKYVLLPSYIRREAGDIFDRRAIYYRISERLTIDIDHVKHLMKNYPISIIMIVDYFGIQDIEIKNIVKHCQDRNIAILQDITYSYLDMFQHSTDVNYSEYGDIVIADLRQTLPVVDGALLSNNCSDVTFKPSETYGIDYYRYIGSQLLGMTMNIYPSIKYIWQSLFDYSDDLLTTNKFANPISSISAYIINHINITSVRDIRINNYQVLLGYLRHIAFYPEKILASGFPILIEEYGKREYIKQVLIANGVYPIEKWALPYNLSVKVSGSSFYLASQLLTLPIDQRYNDVDMERMASVINNLLD